MNIADYRRHLDPLVEPQRFGHDRSILGHLTVHLVLIVGIAGYVAGHVQALGVWTILLAALIAGHSTGICAFAAHEIGHGAVMPPSRKRYLWELAGWTFVLFTSVTVQQWAHNGRHHKAANTPTDPDRRYTVAELAAQPGIGRLATWFFPNRRHPVISAVTGFSSAIFTYHTGLLVHSLRQTGTRYDLHLPDRLRRRALAEFAWNVAVQVALLAASGFAWKMGLFLWFSYVVATTLDGAYIATNHLLTSQSDEHDPVQQTVTVRVPGWIDFLHLRFSHHTEHHLYPTAGPRHYPRIRRLLQAHFPDRYHEMGFGEALKTLLATPVAIRDAHTLVEADDTAPMPVPFPARQPDSLSVV